MNIETLSINELKNIYNTKMQEDFPPSELRPFSSMEYLTELGLYRSFSCRENERELGYALFVANENAALLDYYAIDAACRGQGVGSRFLAGLKEASGAFGAPYVLIEVESVENAKTTEQIEERERRIRFYKHCGCFATGVYSFLFGVEYQIMVLPLSITDAPTDGDVEESLEGIYNLIVSPLVGGNEEKLKKVCSVYRGTKHQPRDFGRELGRAVTFMYRNRSKFMGESLREYGLSGAMYMILLHVGFHPGATQDSIATHMYIDKSNVTRRIKQLEELGYIRREVDLSDRRQNNLYLTDKGEDMLPIIKKYLSQWGESVSSQLSEDELDTLLSLLTKITGK